jgi:hypothetical protein
VGVFGSIKTGGILLHFLWPVFSVFTKRSSDDLLPLQWWQMLSTFNCTQSIADQDNTILSCGIGFTTILLVIW